MTHRRFLAGIILLVSLAIRLIKLDQVPPHLSNDEISIAFDAYSLSLTGREEHGTPLPLAFQSHGTYKAPMYAYLLVPFVHFLGNSDIAARLPSVLCGLITLYAIYHLAYLLCRNSFVALASLLVLACTPWHITTSRMVLETNVGLMFLTLGLVLFFSYKLLPSSLFLSLSMYSYHTQWLLVPGLVLSLFLISRPSHPARIRHFVILFFILSLPLGINFLQNIHTGARANTQMLWNDPSVQSHLASHSLPAQAIILTKIFLSNYLAYLSPSYLFFWGLDLLPSPHPYQPGLFLWPLIIPAFLGLFHSPRTVFFWTWLLLSPAVPALTLGGNSLTRNLVTILPYTILIATGIHQLRLHQIMFPAWLIMTSLSFAYFIPLYLIHYPIEKATTFQNYKTLAAWLSPHQAEYSQIVVDDRFGQDLQYIGVPHLYLGYYLRLSPKLLQLRTHQTDGVHFANFVISYITWSKISLGPHSLYVTSVGNPPPPSLHLILQKSVPDAEGRTALQAWSF